MSSTPPPPPGPPEDPYGQQPPPVSPQWSVGEAVSYGWAAFRRNLGQVLIAVLVVIAVNAVLQLVSLAAGDSALLGLVFNLVSIVVTTIVSAGIIRGALDITEGRGLEVASILTPPRLGQVVVLALVTGIATTIGFLLLILPGLVVLFFTAFSTYFLMDRPDLDAIGAIKASVTLVKDNVGSVLLWFLTCLGLVIAGTLACLVGLVVALPVVYLGTAYTYKRLTGQTVTA